MASTQSIQTPPVKGRVTIKTVAAHAGVSAGHRRRLRPQARLRNRLLDVQASLPATQSDFVLLDVRSPAHFAASHIPGATSLPRGKMPAHRMSQWPAETLFVVYCAGPHCNGTDKAALRLARLGLCVKVMIGGMTGWADEGFPVETGAAIAAA